MFRTTLTATLVLGTLAFPRPASADYIVTGPHEATVCTGWGIKLCSIVKVDAVAKGDTVYSLKEQYDDVDEYRDGRCHVRLNSWVPTMFLTYMSGPRGYISSYDIVSPPESISFPCAEIR
jgi:hypothetical protein